MLLLGTSKVLTGHTHWVGSVAFAPDGATVASGSYDKTVRLWDVQSGKFFCVHVSPNSLPPPPLIYMLLGTSKELIGHTFWVRSVAFAPDGATVASGSSDRTVRLWDVKSGKFCVHVSRNPLPPPPLIYELLGTSKELIGHTSYVNSVAFATVASGSSDCTVRLWDVQSGKFVFAFHETHFPHLH